MESSGCVSSKSLLEGIEDSLSCISSALSFGEVAFFVVELPVDTASFNIKADTMDVRFSVLNMHYMKLRTC